MKNYEFIEKIGRGTHGTTYLLRNKSSEYVVCKSIPDKYAKHAERETAVLNQTGHQRVVKMLENIKVKNGTYIILEYANHGTLESLIRYFKKSGSAINSRLIWSVAAQVLDGLRHLHSLNIIHRDIKPANILINQIRHNGSSFLEFKIADFSLSTQKTAVEDRSVIGTPYYMAPEIVSKQKYDQRVDVWALGVIIYEMHHNSKPFSGSTRDVLYDEILNKDVTAQKSIKNDSLGSLIRRCLSRKQRPTPRELIKGSEKLRLTLTTIELRQREIQIEKLETRLKKSKVDQR